MYTLINPKGTQHNFTGKNTLAQSMDDIELLTPVKFDGVEFDVYIFTVTSCMIINRGDFILRHCDSGRIGVFEVVDSSYLGVSPVAGAPFERRRLKVIDCGEICEEVVNRPSIAIYSHYGVIPEPAPVEEMPGLLDWFWSLFR